MCFELALLLSNDKLKEPDQVRAVFLSIASDHNTSPNEVKSLFEELGKYTQIIKDESTAHAELQEAKKKHGQE